MHSRPEKVSFEASPMRYICVMMVQSPHFDYFGHLMTAMSTILLCFASYDQVSPYDLPITPCHRDQSPASAGAFLPVSLYLDILAHR